MMQFTGPPWLLILSWINNLNQIIKLMNNKRSNTPSTVKIIKNISCLESFSESFKSKTLEMSFSTMRVIFRLSIPAGFFTIHLKYICNYFFENFCSNLLANLSNLFIKNWLMLQNWIKKCWVVIYQFPSKMDIKIVHPCLLMKNKNKFCFLCTFSKI